MPGRREMARFDLSYDIIFETRLAHKVNTLMAQSDRQRVLNNLSCREIYLTKLVSPPNDLRHPSISLSQSITYHRVWGELYDAIFGLQAVALRTLWESVMRLPAELRYNIYAFLLPDVEQELEPSGRGDTNLNPKEKFHVTKGILPNLVYGHRNRYAWELKRGTEIPDHVFIGDEMHKDLIRHFFQSCKFWVAGDISLPIYWTDMWYDEIDLRKTIKHLTFRGTFEVWVRTSMMNHAELEEMWKILTPFLQHCGKDAKWVLDLFNAIKTHVDKKCQHSMNFAL